VIGVDRFRHATHLDADDQYQIERKIRQAVLGQTLALSKRCQGAEIELVRKLVTESHTWLTCNQRRRRSRPRHVYRLELPSEWGSD